MNHSNRVRRLERSELLKISSCVLVYFARIGIAERFGNSQQDELSYNRQNVKKCKYSNWGVSEFSTELKSGQQETLTVASTIGDFTLYDNFKI